MVTTAQFLVWVSHRSRLPAEPANRVGATFRTAAFRKCFSILTTDKKKVSQFGSDAPLGRAGQTDECGTCYVFLASNDASYITGQVLHPNGGESISG